MRFLRYVLGALFAAALMVPEPRLWANPTVSDSATEDARPSVPMERAVAVARPTGVFEPAEALNDGSTMLARPNTTPDSSVRGVPYLNQNEVTPVLLVPARSIATPISQVACGCTSVAMLLAYANKVPAQQSAMIAAVHDCFRATSLARVGVYGPEPLVRYLKQRGFAGAGFLPYKKADPFILAVLREALRDGTPQLLSVRAPSPSGHYIVVTAVEGDDPESAELVVNDPYGRWETCRRPGSPEGMKCYNDPSSNGKGVRYRFTEVTRAGGRLYVIR